jgi:hypothetical protein
VHERPSERVHGGGGLLGAIASEWTKLWTTRTAYICVIIAVVVEVIFTFYYGAIARINNHPLQPVGNAPISAIALVQYMVVVLAMTSVTSEYGTGSIRATLLWVPVRHREHLAKVVVNVVIAFVLGVVLGALGMVVAWQTFKGHAVFHMGNVVPQLLAMGLYLSLIAVFTVGVSFALRTAAAALATTFFLVTALPGMLAGIGGPVLLFINDYMPQTAGGPFMLGRSDPYAPIVGIIVVTAWAIAAHVAGWAVLRKRDA